LDDCRVSCRRGHDPLLGISVLRFPDFLRPLLLMDSECLSGVLLSRFTLLHFSTLALVSIASSNSTRINRYLLLTPSWGRLVHRHPNREIMAPWNLRKAEVNSKFSNHTPPHELGITETHCSRCSTQQVINLSPGQQPNLPAASMSSWFGTEDYVVIPPQDPRALCFSVSDETSSGQGYSALFLPAEYKA